MISMVVLGLISLSIIKIYSVSVPSGAYCASDLYTFTDQYTFNTGSSYNNPAPLSSPMTATVPFANAQSDNQYQVAITFKNLDYKILNNHINVGISYSNPQTSSFNLNVHSANTSNLRSLDIRYLIIKSVFPKFHVSYITVNVNTALAPATNYTKTITIVDQLQYFDCNDNSFYSFTSLNLQAPSQLFSFQMILTGVSAKTQLNFNFSNLAGNESLTVFSVTFVLVRERVDITSPPMRAMSLSTCDQSINTLFGMTRISNVSNNYINYTLSLVNTLIVFSSNNGYAYFQYSCFSPQTYLITCCSFPTVFYNPVTNQCHDVCPPRLYSDNSSMLCQLCPYDCWYCSNTTIGICLSCTLDDYRQLQSSIGRCVPIRGYFDVANLSRCQRCASDCLECSSLTVCTICISGEVPVIGGCSKIFGCSEISANSTNSTEICIACLYPYQLINNTCICSFGTWLTSNNYCTNVIGCLTIANINGTMQCVFCKQNFTLNSTFCSCIFGYELQIGLNMCIETCGDGRRFVDPCDDGNLINGDGCSSSCRIEPNYECHNGSQTHVSLCLYLKGYQIKVYSINKTLGQNQGIFVFQIFPNFHQIFIDKLIVSLSFKCNQNITINGWSLNNNILTVKVEYYEDLQGNQANLSLKLNPTYPVNEYLNITFHMNSGGIKLLIYHNYAKMGIIRLIIFFILGFPLLLFVLGSITHKMLGVQILTTFQIILFISTLSTNYTQPYIILNYLSSVTFNFYYYVNFFSNFYSSQPSHQYIYTFSKINLYLSQEIIGGIILLLSLFPIARLLLRCFIENKRSKYIEKIDSITRVVYNHMLFPLGIGFLYIGVFAYSSHSYSNFQSADSNRLIALMQLLLVTIISQVFFCEWASFLMDGMSFSQTKVRQILIKQGNTSIINSLKVGEPICQFMRCNRNYIPAYLLYLCLIFFLFWVANVYNYRQLLFGIAGLVFIAATLFIQQRPYDDTIHNAGQTINFLLVFSFALWVLLREFFSSFAVEDNQIFALFLLITMMIITLILTVARVVFECLRCWKQRCSKQQKISMQQQKKSENQKLLKNNQISKQIQKMNPFRLKTQLLGEYNEKWNAMNKERLSHNVNPLSNDRFRKQTSNEKNLASKNRRKQMNFQHKEKQTHNNEVIRKNRLQNELSSNRKRQSNGK